MVFFIRIKLGKPDVNPYISPDTPLDDECVFIDMPLNIVLRETDGWNSQVRLSISPIKAVGCQHQRSVQANLNKKKFTRKV